MAIVIRRGKNPVKRAEPVAVEQASPVFEKLADWHMKFSQGTLPQGQELTRARAFALGVEDVIGHTDLAVALHKYGKFQGVRGAIGTTVRQGEPYNAFDLRYAIGQRWGAEVLREFEEVHEISRAVGDSMPLGGGPRAQKYQAPIAMLRQCSPGMKPVRKAELLFELGRMPETELGRHLGWVQARRHRAEDERDEETLANLAAYNMLLEEALDGKQRAKPVKDDGSLAPLPPGEKQSPGVAETAAKLKADLGMTVTDVGTTYTLGTVKSPQNQQLQDWLKSNGYKPAMKDGKAYMKYNWRYFQSPDGKMAVGFCYGIGGKYNIGITMFPYADLFI